MIDELKNNIIFTINEILLIKDNRQNHYMKMYINKMNFIEKFE